MAVSDTAELSVQAAQPAPGGGSDNVAAIAGSTSLAVNDTAELFVQPGQLAPSGGSGTVAAMGDSATLVVRDSSGQIKQQQTVQ